MNMSINRIKIAKGERFGRLTYIREVNPPVCVKKSQHRIGLFKCDCGKTHTTRFNSVRTGHATSCGCFHAELTKKLGESNKIAVGQASKNALYSKYRQGALKRGLAFDIDMELFEKITKENCHYCNQLPTQEYKNRSANGTYLHNGIDRVNNTIGYTVSNCVACCWICNKMKGTLTSTEFYNQVKKIQENCKLL
jgi:hypothetical protein